MKRILAIALSITGMMGCNEQNETKQISRDTVNFPETKKDSLPVTHCYRYAANGDTILMNLEFNGATASGTLLYQLNGKDRNQGTVKGSIKGHVFIADYSFNSEGIASIRQVVFEKRGNAFNEGFGEVKSEGNRIYFKNLGDIKFSDAMPMVEVACR